MKKILVFCIFFGLTANTALAACNKAIQVPESQITKELVEQKTLPCLGPLAKQMRLGFPLAYVVEITVDEEGKVVQAKTVKGLPILEKWVVDPILKWRYKKGERGQCRKSTVTWVFYGYGDICK